MYVEPDAMSFAQRSPVGFATMAHGASRPFTFMWPVAGGLKPCLSFV